MLGDEMIGPEASRNDGAGDLGQEGRAAGMQRTKTFEPPEGWSPRMTICG